MEIPFGMNKVPFVMSILMVNGHKGATSMDFYYTCRHCQANMGTISERKATWQQLGFHQLSESDYDELVQYDTFGNLQVQVICEDCEEALRHNPSLHGIDYIIQ